MPRALPDRALLLDFGGTLDGDGVHWSDRFLAAYRRAGIAVAEADLGPAFAAADRAIEARSDTASWTLLETLSAQVHGQMLALGLEPARAIPVVEMVHAEARAILARSRRLLARLAGHFRLGVVSNFNGNLATVCAEAGLIDYLELLLDSKVEGLSKPDPRLYARALERLRLPASAATMVGDSFERDIAPAKGLGLRTIWLRADPDLPCPDPALVDCRIRTLEELPAALGVEGA